MSSHPTRGKSFKGLILLYFSGPMSPCLHSSPQLHAKHGCWAPVGSDGHFSRLNPRTPLCLLSTVGQVFSPPPASPFGNSVMKCPRPAKIPFLQSLASHVFHHFLSSFTRSPSFSPLPNGRHVSTRLFLSSVSHEPKAEGVDLRGGQRLQILGYCVLRCGYDVVSASASARRCLSASPTFITRKDDVRCKR